MIDVVVDVVVAEYVREGILTDDLFLGPRSSDSLNQQAAKGELRDFFAQTSLKTLPELSRPVPVPVR